MAGVKYVRLHFTDVYFANDTGNNNTLQVTDNLTSIALGPQVWLHGSWGITSCLKLRGHVGGGILASAAQTKLNQTNGGLDLRCTENPDWFWHVINNLDVKLGVQIGTMIKLPNCTLAFPFSIEAGYELLYFSDFTNRVYFLDDVADGLLLNQWSSFTMQGPYVRANLSF